MAPKDLPFGLAASSGTLISDGGQEGDSDPGVQLIGYVLIKRNTSYLRRCNSSFVSQSLHRVQSSGAAGGKIAGHGRETDHQQCHRGDGWRIVGLEAEKQRGE